MYTLILHPLHGTMTKIIVFCCLLLFSQPLTAMGQKDAAETPPAKSQAKKKGGQAAKKVEAPAPAEAVSTDEVQEEFAAYVITFVDKLNRVHDNSITRMKVTKLDDGSYVARYHAIDTSTIESSVKPTGHPVTPFVGTLKYVENVYEGKGATAQAAQSAPFNVVDSTRVTELFARSKKGWE